jgi:hypothetical protein
LVATAHTIRTAIRDRSILQINIDGDTAIGFTVDKTGASGAALELGILLSALLEKGRAG